MVYQYPPSPHTILPRIITDHGYRHHHADIELSPTTPMPPSQDAPGRYFTASESYQEDFRLHSRRTSLSSRRMRVSTDVPHHQNPPSSTSASSSSPIAGSSKSHQSIQMTMETSSSSSATTQGYPKGVSLASRRRQSRFDPMSKGDDEMDDEEYGELGHRHPLRRVTEEEGKEGREGGLPESISLPGIKALFGVAGTEQPPTPSSSISLYASPSLPSLIPTSPSSSPSTARTSRYSSLGSTASAASEPFHVPAGWWAPPFDPASPRPLNQYRANSFPITQPFVDEHADKRRRSDGPPALRDAEESARLRWQAQSRNASFPSSGPSTPGGSGLRSLLHPPPSSSAMSRQSISGLSGSSGFSSPLTPFVEHPSPPSSSEFPFDRRTSTVGPTTMPSRSASIVGGQLAQSFAGLSASEQDRERRSPSAQPNMDMPPPMQLLPDRRQSTFQHSPLGNSPSRPQFPSISISRPQSTGPDALRRQSLTRPPTPEPPSRPGLRRSSLTEIIIAKTGDDVSSTSGSFQSQNIDTATTALLRKSSISDPSPAQAYNAPVTSSVPLITGWQPRRVSTDSAASAPAISLNSDNEGGSTMPPLRGLKRGAVEREIPSLGLHTGEVGDVDMKEHDPGMRGMEVLAESASRVSEAELGKPQGTRRDKSPNKPAGGGAAANAAAAAGAAGATGPKYTCEYCDKVFTRPSSLRIHKHSHTGERPFVCEVQSCRRRFSVQSNLKRHAKVHHNGGIAGGASLTQLGNPGAARGFPTSTRPMEELHRAPMHSHPGHPGHGGPIRPAGGGGGFYSHHPIPAYGGPPYQSQSQSHGGGGGGGYPPHSAHGQYSGGHGPSPPGPASHSGGAPIVHPPPHEGFREEEWSGEEDELDEEDELEEEEGDE